MTWSGPCTCQPSSRMQTQADPAALPGGSSDNCHYHYPHNCLQWGVTQGNIVNEAKFIPCPVVISWRSQRLLKVGQTVLCLYVKCNSILIAKKCFTCAAGRWEHTLEHALWGSVPCAAVGPQPLNTVTPSLGLWQTKLPHKCPKRL